MASKVESVEDLAEEQKGEFKGKADQCIDTKVRPPPERVNHDSESECLVQNPEPDEELQVPETENLTDQERTKLFEKGTDFKRKGNYNHAILCLLGCLKGLKPGSHFLFLPQCLQEIAGLYAKSDDYERAVQFMQAAKLYYETAIIESGAKLNALKKEEGLSDDYEPVDDNASKEEAQRANEYERLSHSCLKEKKIQLALEYCGKATQIRRKLYGDNHPVTIKSLDLFTVTYAEMGKMQYSKAMDKMSNFSKEDDNQVEVGKDEGHMSMPVVKFIYLSKYLKLGMSIMDFSI